MTGPLADGIVLTSDCEGREALGLSGHGGLAVVFPSRGAVRDAHARSVDLASERPWTVAASRAGPWVALRLEDQAEPRALWPHRSRAGFEASLERGLRVTRTVTDTGPAPLADEEAPRAALNVGAGERGAWTARAAARRALPLRRRRSRAPSSATLNAGRPRSLLGRTAEELP